MPDMTTQRWALLEQRYDGPIPAQHHETERTEHRRRRGALAVLEAQAAQFLDAAERCLNEAEDVTADLTERRLARWQREVGESRLQSVQERCDSHLRAAAYAMRKAIPLRRELGLGPHPIIVLATLLRESSTEKGQKDTENSMR